MQSELEKVAWFQYFALLLIKQKTKFCKQQNLEKNWRIRIFWRFRCREQVIQYNKIMSFSAWHINAFTRFFQEWHLKVAINYVNCFFLVGHTYAQVLQQKLCKKFHHPQIYFPLQKFQLECILIQWVFYRGKLFSKENELAERLEAWIWDSLKILALIFTLIFKNIQTIPESIKSYFKRKEKQKVVEFLLLLKNIFAIYLVSLPLKGSSGMSGFLMGCVLNPFIDIYYTLMVISNSHTKQPNMSFSDKVEMELLYVFLSAAIFCSLYFINSFQYFVMLLLLTLLRQ